MVVVLYWLPLKQQSSVFFWQLCRKIWSQELRENEMKLHVKKKEALFGEHVKNAFLIHSSCFHLISNALNMTHGTVAVVAVFILGTSIRKKVRPMREKTFFHITCIAPSHHCSSIATTREKVVVTNKVFFVLSQGCLVKAIKNACRQLVSKSSRMSTW